MDYLRKKPMEVVYLTAAEAPPGIKQQTLSAVLAGTRNLGREDLRALSRISIPADYLLGIDKVFVPNGETRIEATLETDLAARVARESINALTVPEAWLREMLIELIDGKAILAALVRAVTKEADAAAMWLRQKEAVTVELSRVYGDPGRAPSVLTESMGASPPSVFIRLQDKTFKALAIQMQTAIKDARRPKKSTKTKRRK